MDPKSNDARMFLAPGACPTTNSYSFPTAERRPTPPPPALDARFPPLDDHLVIPEVSREEIIDGRVVQTMGANPEHAEAHTRLDFVIMPHVREGFIAATDLLTRINEKSNFATDTCVRKIGTDAATGKRYLEELSFEIVNEQSLSDVTDKARNLTERGVRRVFAIFVKIDEIREWSVTRNAFVPLDKDSFIEDPLLIRPIAVRSLLDLSAAEAEVLEAFIQKNHPGVDRIRRDASEEAHKKGHKKGFDEGRREAPRAYFTDLVLAKFHVIPDDLKQRIDGASNDDLTQWGRRLLTATSLDEVFI